MSKLISLIVLVVLALSVVKPLDAQERIRIAWAGSTPSNTPMVNSVSFSGENPASSASTCTPLLLNDWKQ